MRPNITGSVVSNTIFLFYNCASYSISNIESYDYIALNTTDIHSEMFYYVNKTSGHVLESPVDENTFTNIEYIAGTSFNGLTYSSSSSSANVKGCTLNRVTKVNSAGTSTSVDVAVGNQIGIYTYRSTTEKTLLDLIGLMKISTGTDVCLCGLYQMSV